MKLLGKKMLEKIEREKRTQIDQYEKKAHLNWMAQKSADSQIQASIRQQGDLAVRKGELERELVQVRNMSGMGAPDLDYSDSDDEPMPVMVRFLNCFDFRTFLFSTFFEYHPWL